MCPTTQMSAYCSEENSILRKVRGCRISQTFGQENESQRKTPVTNKIRHKKKKNQKALPKQVLTFKVIKLEDIPHFI